MRISFFFLCTVLLFACKNNRTEPVARPQEAEAVDSSNFFPVTNFLKGDIANIKNIGIAPLKKTTVNGRIDSAFLKPEQYDAAFADFISPVIDTANLKGIFTEKKFLDQTINAVTFTYDPANEKANDFAFTHWDVYVDPESGKVTRVYLVKKNGPDQQLQLTWRSGKSCKIVTINTGTNGSVIKEENISWNYDDK